MVLPAPFGPMIATTSPGYSSKLTRSSAIRAPKLLVTPRAATVAAFAVCMPIDNAPQATVGPAT